MVKYFLFLAFFLSAIASAQPGWHLLPNSPVQTFRHDDVFFITENKGWVVNVNGQVWKTYNGGQSWIKTTQQSTSFRCIGFLDSLHGFAGNLGPGAFTSTPDTNPLYQTADGGNTWNPVTNISGPRPKGICGMRIVSDSVIVACGRIDSPAFFIRSVDRGLTWTSKYMGSYAGFLIDLSFISRDTGFAVGGNTTDYHTAHSIILYTTDGGLTWVPKIIGAAAGDHGWKIEKADRNTYYVSVERVVQTDTLKYFKSTDAGNTWTEHVIAGTKYGWSQGIGFANSSVGWIGGDKSSLTTNDGGLTFSSFPTFMYLNRIRFVNDSVGYAVGRQIYKYSNSPAGIEEHPDLNGYALRQNVPNPFHKTTSVTYTIPRTEEVVLELFDDAGRKIRSLVNEKKSAGTYTLEFSLPDGASGTFICALSAGRFGKAIKMYAVK
ncbi:MAG TPA: hypothetical protein VGO45_03820 [Bacteroidia bacterium]|jgi:photosystem II stability/assembly factor-like uncharacterized protein|nr:hypothetical protein [Bacteroidia bacterium]